MTNISDILEQNGLDMTTEIILLFFSNFSNLELSNFMDEVLEIEPQTPILLCLFNTHKDLSDFDLRENFLNSLKDLLEIHPNFCDFISSIYENLDLFIIPCYKTSDYEEYSNFIMEVRDIPFHLFYLEDEFYEFHGFIKFLTH